MSIINLNTGNFDEEIKDGKVFVDFWAGWCGPCKMLAPIIEALAGEAQGLAKVAKVDVEEESALAARYKILSIPTVILFENGVEVKRFIGVRQKEEFLAAL